MLEKIINAIPSSWIFFIIAAIFLFIGITSKNNNFFDVRKIFKQHFEVLNGNKFQIILFYITPLLLAMGIVKLKVIDKDIINNMNIVISIFISMFFAMLSILCSFQLNESHEESTKKLYNQLLKETFNSILFESCLCIILLSLTIVELFIDSFALNWHIFIASTIIYYLLLVIVFNIFIILKRIKKLFDNR